MRARLPATIALLAFGAATAANAADMAPTAPPPVWNWTGLYVGAHVGASWGIARFADPLGAPIYGDDVRTPGFLGGGQIGYNWQTAARWVVGVEADIGGLDSDGTDTCFAVSGNFASSNCRVRPDALATLTGRIGYAAGPEGRTLLYAKGGAAWLHGDGDINLNAADPPVVTGGSHGQWGGTVGAGVEQALSPAWSMKIEYDFVRLASVDVGTPASGFFSPAGAQTAVVAAGTTGLSGDLHVVKLGLNYRVGADPWASWDFGATSRLAVPTPAYRPAPVAAWTAGWELEVGGRYWLGSGRFQKDLGSFTTPPQDGTLNSRLTYAGLTAHSGEFFGRVDTPWNVFIKGFIGAGRIGDGQLNDEDWGLSPCQTPLCAYSNTISAVNGSLQYATIDMGYDLLRGSAYKLGVFAGYNSFSEYKSGFGCVQIANQNSDCAGAGIPTSVAVITENDRWQSVRVGLNGEAMLTPRLKLTGDVAYLPHVRFDGTDDHVLRNLVSPEWGWGRGVQVETIVSYYVTPVLGVGVGGRYWAMWTTDAYTAFGGAPCPCQTLPSRTERYGGFLQASYRFEEPGALAARY